MINEKKLIEEMNKTFPDRFLNDKNWFMGKCSFMDLFQEIIEQMPKVGEWIPCSERLPKYTDEYNVTVGVASEFGYYERVTTLRFENIQGKKPKWIIPVDKVYRVIAWMPLPAPYNAERGGKND